MVAALSTDTVVILYVLAGMLYLWFLLVPAMMLDDEIKALLTKVPAAFFAVAMLVIAVWPIVWFLDTAVSLIRKYRGEL